MATLTKVFEAVGRSGELLVRPGDAFSYTADLSDDPEFDGRLYLESAPSYSRESRKVVAQVSADVETAITIRNDSRESKYYSFRCEYSAEEELEEEPALTGTATVTLSDVAVVQQEIGDSLKVKEDGVEVVGTLEVSGNITPGGVVRASQKRLYVGGRAGATAGWAGANNIGLSAFLPQSQTASTWAIPLTGLKHGATITDFHVIAQIESDGNAVTLDADLRAATCVAGDFTDASVGAITQVEASADKKVDATNAKKAGLAEVVADDKIYYVLVTGTTGETTDIALGGVVVEVDEA